ncbi:MAG: pyrimidine/purine nucleoside phosphorylase [Sulfurovaceae bacterium]|nr:pyrimidine/purine nucleoside phosphorylase [Sulfurovaceae bacterium]
MIFSKVDVIKEANIYFDGKVTSRTVVFPDGTKKTLGIMLPGDYEFGTDSAEEMEIMSGKLRVKLPQNDDWIDIIAPASFHVPANSKFSLEVITITDYCCSYLV